jgi:hypothetical protein
MSDVSKQSEQRAEVEHPDENIADLPPKPLSAKEADAVKGGATPAFELKDYGFGAEIRTN